MLLTDWLKLVLGKRLNLDFLTLVLVILVAGVIFSFTVDRRIMRRSKNR